MEQTNQTDFGTNKIQKIVGLKYDQFSPFLVKNITSILNNDFNEATAVDMSLNSNIALYGPNTVLDYGFEIEGSPIQAGVLNRIIVRMPQVLNQLTFKKSISPRVSWVNDIHDLVIVRTNYQYRVYFGRESGMHYAGQHDEVFNSLKASKIERVLKQLRPGEGMVFDYNSNSQGLTPKEAISVFVKEQNMPERIVRSIARLCAVT